VTIVEGVLRDLFATAAHELDGIATAQAPAIMRLARLRRPIAAIGVASAVLDIEAIQHRDAYDAIQFGCPGSVRRTSRHGRPATGPPPHDRHFHPGIAAP
jgi:hypothetical protein